MVELRLDDVTKSYAGTPALDGVSLSVDDGEFFTLVGPSGCGKTTTLRLVAGFEQPTSGSVRFDGRDVSGVPPEERNVGVVLQNYALFPHMSVGENVAYGLRFRDPPTGGTEARVDELLGLVGLDGFADRSPDTLSGGQQQRVALARALAPGPRLLLLDEPMSALDAQLRERLRMKVREIQQELGVTTLYVTHDQEEALAVSDRVAVVDDGRVEQVGGPRALYRRPATRFVAEFIGDNNVFVGDCSESPLETEGSTFRVGDATFRLPVDAAPGESVTFCVRPERLSVGAGENRFEARVTGSEFLGDATRVHCQWNSRDVVLRTETDDPPTGRVDLGFDAADAHVISCTDSPG